MLRRSRRIQLLSVLVIITFTGVGSGRPTNLETSDFSDKTLYDNYPYEDDTPSKDYQDEASPNAMVFQPDNYGEYSELSEKKLTDWDRDKATPDDEYGDYWLEDLDSKRMDKLLKEDGDRWPTFEEIEKLAGLSEWKRERWKQLTKSEDVRTEKPTRKVKFIYRRIQTSGKRNAIIAVSAVSTDTGNKV